MKKPKVYGDDAYKVMLNITYNDGSNPFIMRASLKWVMKEVNYQTKRIGESIKVITILNPNKALD